MVKCRLNIQKHKSCLYYLCTTEMVRLLAQSSWLSQRYHLFSISNFEGSSVVTCSMEVTEWPSIKKIGSSLWWTFWKRSLYLFPVHNLHWVVFYQWLKFLHQVFLTSLIIFLGMAVPARCEDGNVVWYFQRFSTPGFRSNLQKIANRKIAHLCYLPSI